MIDLGCELMEQDGANSRCDIIISSITLFLHGLGDATSTGPERGAAVSAETGPVSHLTAVSNYIITLLHYKPLSRRRVYKTRRL